MLISESKMKNILMLFCVMSKFPWSVNGVYCNHGKKLLVHKEIQVEKQ